MEEGFTGLSPEAATEQLTNFKSLFDGASYLYWNGYNDFAKELSTKWYSPKAVEFNRLTSIVMTELNDTQYRVLGTILRNATSSYNILMRANGLTDNHLEGDYQDYFESSEHDWWNKEFSIEFKEEGPNGEVGMNTLLAKMLVSEFQKKIDASYIAFDELPLDIAFYDPDGALKQAFRDLINNYKQVIQEKLKEIIDAVNEAMDTEIENITIAKNEATEVLSETTVA